MAEEYVFGANILDNLTTGMYKDSTVIYREYIQNACDQIDVAVNSGMMTKEEAYIDIELNEDERTVIIKDNATGIKSEDFRRILGNIADSDKRMGETKGFRGIGRLCGLAYCKEVIFSAKAKGEKIISVMKCDADKMRRMINENASHEKKYTATDVLKNIFSFRNISTTQTDEHWFKVELIGINDENTEILDFDKVKQYLSFVAPVPYKNSFIFRTKIYEHAKEIGFKIDEYSIKLNGEDIYKDYRTNYKISKGEDEIKDVRFKDFCVDRKIIAWMWIGISYFKGVMNPSVLMRGIRLRKENIQIGNSETLNPLFRELRGNNYFIGEVFVCDKNLVPNSQRNYFNENPARVVFEKELHNYFVDNLTLLYYKASEINSAYKTIGNAIHKRNEFERKKEENKFINNDLKKKSEQTVEQAEKDAETAKKNLDKIRKKLKDNEVIENILNRRQTELEKDNRKEKDFKEGSNSGTDGGTVNNEKSNQNKKNPFITGKLSQYSKKEQKLIGKIFEIIYDVVDSEEMSNKIIEAIVNQLKGGNNE